jgi:hypothetical protein
VPSKNDRIRLIKSTSNGHDIKLNERYIEKCGGLQLIKTVFTTNTDFLQKE